MATIALQTFQVHSPFGGEADTLTKDWDTTSRKPSLVYHYRQSASDLPKTWKCRIVSAKLVPMNDTRVVLYAVTTTLPDGTQYTVLRRFSRFQEFLESVTEFYKAEHCQFVSNLPQLPPRGWLWEDHNSSAFVRERRDQLSCFLNRLMGIPHITECPAVRSFLLDAGN